MPEKTPDIPIPVDEVAPRFPKFDDRAQAWRNFWKKNGPLVQGVSLVTLSGLFLIGSVTYYQQKKEADARTDAIVTDIANSRFVNSKKSCEVKNSDNRRIHRVFLKYTPATKRKQTLIALEEAWPTKTNCENYAFTLICTKQQRKTLPACLAYLAKHPDIKDS